MDYVYDPKEKDRVISARESFSGRLLTDSQFDEGMAITRILEGEIKRSGSFKEKLGDYAFAYARSERFDAAKGESILRDLFKERTGQTMNQMRETLQGREETFSDEARQQAYQAASDIGPMIENGDKMSYYRAYTHQAAALATELGITDAGAGRLMSEEFKAVERMELYDWGKELEDRFYRPQIEAERQEREAGRSRSREQTSTRSTRARQQRQRGPELRR